MKGETIQARNLYVSLVGRKVISQNNVELKKGNNRLMEVGN
jgi:hypothetical protein